MGLAKNIIEFPSNSIKFLREVAEELRKVSWSTKEELIAATAVVLVALVFLTVYIALVDIGLSKIMRFILQ